MPGKNSVPELKNGGKNSVPLGFGRVKRTFGVKRRRIFFGLYFLSMTWWKLNFLIKKSGKHSVPRLKTLVKNTVPKFRNFSPKVNFTRQNPPGTNLRVKGIPLHLFILSINKLVALSYFCKYFELWKFWPRKFSLKLKRKGLNRMWIHLSQTHGFHRTSFDWEVTCLF